MRLRQGDRSFDGNGLSYSSQLIHALLTSSPVDVHAGELPVHDLSPLERERQARRLSARRIRPGLPRVLARQHLHHLRVELGAIALAALAAAALALPLAIALRFAAVIALLAALAAPLPTGLLYKSSARFQTRYVRQLYVYPKGFIVPFLHLGLRYRTDDPCSGLPSLSTHQQ